MTDQTTEDGSPPGDGDGGGRGNGGGGAGTPANTPAAEPQREVLSLSQLIGAPIRALVEAEAQSAAATAHFIRNVGFKPPDDAGLEEFGELQMARFKTVRRNTDGAEEEVEVQIPLLTLLPIPALQIRDATLDYVVKVVQTEALPPKRQPKTQSPGTGTPLSDEVPATLRATFAREPRPGDRRSMDMLVKMKVRIEQADMPAGLSRLINLAGESTSRTALPKPEEPDDEA